MQRQRHDGQGEVRLDGEEGQHEAAAENTSVNISATSAFRIPVDCGPDEDGPLGPDSPAHVSHNRHGGTLEDRLGGGEEHKVIVSESFINTSQLPLNSREVVVVPVSGVVPHVGGEVAVDVGVGEVRREAQAEDEASEDAEPASGLASD